MTDVATEVIRVCGARLRSAAGGRCQHVAGWGTDHVGFGRCKQHGGSTRDHRKAAALEAAAHEAASMGIALDIGPHEQLLACVHLAGGQLQFLTAKVAALKADEVMADAGELHAWIRAQQDAIDRSARLSRMAIDAGIAERAVRIAEDQAERIAAVMRAAVDELNLGDDVRGLLLAAFAKHSTTLLSLPGPSLVGFANGAAANGGGAA